MAKISTVVIQKPDSSFRDLVEQVLQGRFVIRHQAPPERPLSESPPPMVLWDTSGFEQDELESIAALLAPEPVGVLVLCPELDPACRRALARCQALGLACRPSGPAALAAHWELARDLHRRLLALRAEHDTLQVELAERRLIDRAKLLVMAASGCSESQALKRLQLYSRRHNRRLVEVAQGLISGYEFFDDQEDD